MDVNRLATTEVARRPGSRRRKPNAYITSAAESMSLDYTNQSDKAGFAVERIHGATPH